MNRTLMRSLFVITLSAGLMAPAHAVDFRLWFYSLSSNSRNALYVATAATVAAVAGLSFWAYKMYSKVQPDLDAKKIQELEEATRSLNSKCKALEKTSAEIGQELAQKKLLQQQREKFLAQKKEQQRKAAQEIRSKLTRLKDDHAKLRTDIATVLKNESSAMQSDMKNLTQIQGSLQKKAEGLEKANKASIEQQRNLEEELRALISEEKKRKREERKRIEEWISSIGNDEVDDLISALTGKQGKLTHSKKTILALCSERRQLILDKLQKRKVEIEEAKKKEEERRAVGEKEKREAAQRVSEIMDREVKKQINGNR